MGVIAAMYLIAAVGVVAASLYITLFQMVAHVGALLSSFLIFLLATVLSADPTLDGPKDGIAIVTIFLVLFSWMSILAQWLAWYADYKLSQTLKDFNIDQEATSSLNANLIFDDIGAGFSSGVFGQSNKSAAGFDDEGPTISQWKGLAIDPLRVWYHRGTGDQRLYNTADEQYNLAVQRSIMRRSEYVVDFMGSEPAMTRLEEQRMGLELEQLDMEELESATNMRMLSPREVVAAADHERLRARTRVGSQFMPPPPAAVRIASPRASSARQQKKKIAGGATRPPITPSRELDYDGGE
eukprot:GDKJ01059571.1.p1 GENE.GDKJ01059571.1~~GDKJ01059571.1.p1  ORF type:complete len:297 (+),score=5.03 GDKJ01059571.1:3-893(+)